MQSVEAPGYRRPTDGAKWRWLPLTLAAVAMVGWGGVALWIDHVYGDYRLARLRAQAANVGAAAAGSLANELNRRLALVRGLGAFVAVKLEEGHASELAKEFPVFARAVYGTAEGVRNISVSPDFVVRLVYPADPGNLKVIGNDLRADKRPGFAEAVQRAVARHGMAVHEPVTLIQGGLGLIARDAVYQGETPWGAVGMVFSVEPLLAQFHTSLAAWRWGVRTAAGTQVGGSPEVFSQQAVTARVELPEGYWELAIEPRAGWSRAADEGADKHILRLCLLAIGGLLATATWIALRRRLLLEQLVAERTRALTAANTELSSFAYVAAHDLQEPLRAITTFSQLVERDFSATLGTQGRQWLETVVASARRMKELLSDIQVFLAEQDLPLPSQLMPAQDGLDAAVHALSRRIEETGAVIRQVGTLPLVVADRSRLTEILSTLIDNAIEYRSPERPPVISVEARQQGALVVITVADNGIGIESEYLDRIFVVFQRLHSRAKHPGTGMGLAIARKMVERLGGRLTVRSTPGAGSVFTVELPGAT